MEFNETQFVVGNLYVNNRCGIVALITKRTKATVTASIEGVAKTFRLTMYEGREQFMPWGRYSMAPSIQARA